MDNKTGDSIVSRSEKKPGFWTTGFYTINFNSEENAQNFYNQISGDKKEQEAESYYWNNSLGGNGEQKVIVSISEDKKSVLIKYGNLEQ